MSNPSALLNLLAQSLVDPPVTWQDASTAEQQAWSAALFVLDGCAVGLRNFVEETAFRILRQLQAYTKPVAITYQDRVRGRVHWPATFKSRLEGDAHPLQYVCRETRYQYATPENELFRYTIARIGEAIHHIPPWLRNGVGYAAGEAGPIWLGDQVGPIESALNRLHRSKLLQTIPVPERITEFHFLCARTSRMEEFVRVADVAAQQLAVVETMAPAAIAAIGRRTLLLPATTGPMERRWLNFAGGLLQR
ncbi:MAG: hypothetical protein R3C43_19890 [Chloroflexota bacterium]